MTHEIDPRIVACRDCGARQGERCHAKRGRTAGQPLKGGAAHSVRRSEALGEMVRQAELLRREAGVAPGADLRKYEAEARRSLEEAAGLRSGS